jgi:hypothetical protein
VIGLNPFRATEKTTITDVTNDLDLVAYGCDKYSLHVLEPSMLDIKSFIDVIYLRISKKILSSSNQWKILSCPQCVSETIGRDEPRRFKARDKTASRTMAGNLQCMRD